MITCSTKNFPKNLMAYHNEVQIKHNDMQRYWKQVLNVWYKMSRNYKIYSTNTLLWVNLHVLDIHVCINFSRNRWSRARHDHGICPTGHITVQNHAIEVLFEIHTRLLMLKVTDISILWFHVLNLSEWVTSRCNSKTNSHANEQLIKVLNIVIIYHWEMMI